MQNGIKSYEFVKSLMGLGVNGIKRYEFVFNESFFLACVLFVFFEICHIQKNWIVLTGYECRLLSFFASFDLNLSSAKSNAFQIEAFWQILNSNHLK